MVVLASSSILDDRRGWVTVVMVVERFSLSTIWCFPNLFWACISVCLWCFMTIFRLQPVASTKAARNSLASATMTSNLHGDHGDGGGEDFSPNTHHFQDDVIGTIGQHVTRHCSVRDDDVRMRSGAKRIKRCLSGNTDMCHGTGCALPRGHLVAKFLTQSEIDKVWKTAAENRLSIVGVWHMISFGTVLAHIWWQHWFPNIAPSLSSCDVLCWSHDVLGAQYWPTLALQHWLHNITHTLLSSDVLCWSHDVLGAQYWPTLALQHWFHNISHTLLSSDVLCWSHDV